MNEIKITLPTQPAEQQQAATAAESWANALTITGADDRRQASAGVARLKALEKQGKELFADAKKAASDAHKSICAAEKRVVEPLESARRTAESKMLAYDAEHERLRRIEQARLQAEADAAAERERRRLEAIAARCKDEGKAEAYREQAATVAPATVVLAQPERIEGERVAKVWRAELVDMAALVKAAADGNASAAALLTFDGAAANKMAGMFRRDGVIPGVRFFERAQLAHNTSGM